MRKALLVIDMQEATVGKNHADFFKYDTALLKKVNNVIFLAFCSIMLEIYFFTSLEPK